MPAPNEPLRAPYPNLVIPGWPRVAVHVATVNFVGTAPVLVPERSSGGIAVADAGAGRATITFPAGGTGATGVFSIGPAEAATPSGITFSIDSDLTNFATGTCELDAFLSDADTTADDAVGIVTLLIFVLLGPGGAV